MKKLFVVACLFAFCATGAYAQSAKNALQVADLTLINWTGTDQGWTPILTNTIRTSSQKDLMMGVSLECGLYTRTKVRSKDGTLDTANALAHVKVRVKIDGNVVAEPGEVTFCRRTQELSAKFGGILTCTDTNNDGIVNYGECTTTPEELQLILDTTNANAFFFALDDVGVGPHQVVVEAAIDVGGAATAGEFEAKALVGKGSVTVEEIRLVRGADITL